MRCAKVVSSQSSKLQEYLAEADKTAVDTAGHVDQLTKSFFGNVELMMRAADETLASVQVLRNGEAVTDSLRSAAVGFTPRAYESLGKETAKLLKFFTNFASQVVTPELEGVLPRLYPWTSTSGVWPFFVLDCSC